MPEQSSKLFNHKKVEIPEMQPRKGRPAHQTNDEVVYQPLPAGLADSLEPKAGRALMHGMRRCILRTVNREPTPLTTKDLLTTFPGATLQTVDYHVRVLEDCGALAVSQVERTRGSLTRSLVSSVADDARIGAALRVTERLDDAR
jgi:hypothetical protein